VNGYNYTSGMVAGKAPSAFQYGYAEARVRVPIGQGLGPAFWLLPQDGSWPPEIDILEILGHIPRTVYLSYRTVDSNSQTIYMGPDFSADWHVFAVNWEPTAMVWYIDGVERKRYTSVPEITDKALNLYLTLAVGGNFPGPPNSSTHFPADLLVDYVRVWQRAAGPTAP